MTIPNIDADSARERMRNQIRNAALLNKATTRAIAESQEETQALAEEAQEFDQSDTPPNTNG